MMFPSEVVTRLAVGAAAGFGQAFGQRLVPWVVKSWQWMFGGGPSPNEPLIREVLLATLQKTGIPVGHRLFLKRGDAFQQTSIPQLTPDNCRGVTLWLFPQGDVWNVTPFAANNVLGQAEIGVEFEPESGFPCIVPVGGQFDRSWLSSFLQGAIMGTVNALTDEKRTGLLLAHPESVAYCAQKLDASLRQHGIRCCGIRNVTGQLKSLDPGEASTDAEFQELASELAQIKTEQDWNRLIESLRGAGVPIDPTTTARLESIRNSVLGHQVPAPEGVRQLAELTADAFQRAGIEQRDLQSWQLLSEKLSDVPTEETKLVASPAAVAVATPRKPMTWHVWNRDEVDRRQLLFTRRTVKNCRYAYEQALINIRDLAASRQLRDLKEQVALVEELLTMVPPLNPPRTALRVDRQVAKELVSAYADAVKTTEELATRTDTLLNISPTDPEWSQEFQACRRAASKLSQMVRDRRAIR